jgi:hypothetical protein
LGPLREAPEGAAVNSQGRKPLDRVETISQPWKGERQTAESDMKCPNPLQACITTYREPGKTPSKSRFQKGIRDVIETS